MLTKLAGGQTLKSPAEQDAVVALLERIETTTTLDTSKGIQLLREAWLRQRV